MSARKTEADERVEAVASAEQLIAAFTLDAPVPIRRLFGFYGSRTTFHNWKHLGLDIKHIEGMGQTVIPSRFRAFLLRLRGDATPTNQPVSIRQGKAKQC
jgi:hypothetical protein